MDKKEQAIILMEEFKKCRPPMFFEKLDSYEKGIQFVLGYLEEQEKEVISLDISNALNVSTARMAKILNTMEKKGLIKKVRSSVDGRKTIVALTDKGKDITQKHKEMILKITMKMIDEVGYDDLLEFVRISYKMKNVMSSLCLVEKNEE